MIEIFKEAAAIEALAREKKKQSLTLAAEAGALRPAFIHKLIEASDELVDRWVSIPLDGSPVYYHVMAICPMYLDPNGPREDFNLITRHVNLYYDATIVPALSLVKHYPDGRRSPFTVNEILNMEDVTVKAKGYLEAAR